MGEYAEEDYDSDFEPFEFEDIEPECGMMGDGMCSLAGTEHCDWDCGRLG